MKKTIIQSIIALSLGAISLYIYFCLIGVAFVWSTKIHLYSWILYLPELFHPTLYLLTSHFIEFFVAVPVLGLAGMIIGVIVNKNNVLFGCMGFIGALSFFFIFHIIVYDGELIWIDSVPAWSQIFPYFIWIFIFICSSWIGNNKLKKYFSKE